MVDKVDAGYFTAPITAAQSKPPSQIKQAKPASKPPSNLTPAVPTDLVTPRELKALANRPNGNASSPTGAPTSRKASVAGPSTAVPTEDAQVGQKRKAEETPKEEAARPNGAPGPGSKPRPKPPLVKRPKQGPSLFIPKKVRHYGTMEDVVNRLCVVR